MSVPIFEGGIHTLLPSWRFAWMGVKIGTGPTALLSGFFPPSFIHESLKMHDSSWLTDWLTDQVIIQLTPWSRVLEQLIPLLEQLSVFVTLFTIARCRSINPAHNLAYCSYNIKILLLLLLFLHLRLCLPNNPLPSGFMSIFHAFLSVPCMLRAQFILSSFWLS